MRRPAVLLTALLLTACSSSGAPARPTVARYPIAQPVGLAAAGGQVWAVSAYDGALVAFDRRTGRRVRTVQVGDTPLRVTADGATVWATVFGTGRVVAVDTASGKVVHSVAVPGQPEGIAAGFGALWVVRQQARLLTRISPDGVAGADYRLGAEPRLVAVTDHYVVASNFADGTLTRLDPRTGALRASARLCEGAQGLAARATTVWVTCTPAGLLLAVDERTLAVTGRLRIGGEPDAVRTDGRRLFVAATAGPTVHEIRPDPRHPTVVRSRSLGSALPLADRANVDLVLAGGRVWVSSFGEDGIAVAPW